ncbi:calcium-binding EGF domain-containing protein [Phthorimaea operculella]|nr:calcium-binding EGF domain-containing protein [Phthorimaea operculella]
MRAEDKRGLDASSVHAEAPETTKRYEESYTISQLSPKSASADLPRGVLLQTSRESFPSRIEPSARFDEHIDDVDIVPDDVIIEEEKEDHVIVARSVYAGDDTGSHVEHLRDEPNEDDEKEKDIHVRLPRSADRESRSINFEDVPHNNEIDNDLEAHNKRKYYEIHPTKTNDYLRGDDEILTSEGFGDRLEFRFPGEAQRVPKARALSPPGPKIRPTAVQPIFATASLKDQGRQNTEIQNIITGIVKLLNGNVNVQANSQLLNGRPGRPMNSRINNRGPPRISDVPLLPDFDKPITPPGHVFVPTKTPPPYPFDRPPHHGVNLPEQIVPPMSYRPGLHRPIPPWQRPRPRPPTRRPYPGLPMHKPMPPLPQSLPDLDDSKPDEELTISENETHSENNIHHEENSASTSPVTTLDSNTTETEEEYTTLLDTTSPTTTSTTTEKPTTPKPTTEKPTTTSEKPTTSEIPTTTTEKQTTTEKPTTTPKPSTTTEKIKTEKPSKQDKKKETVEKEKPTKEKFKPVEDKQNRTRNETTIELQSSIADAKPTLSINPTPTDGLFSHASTFSISNAKDIVKTSINTQPIPTSQSSIPYAPYRPRPGVVLDDPDFKPHGSRRRPVEAAVITAAETRLPGYGEIFDVTVSAIQGPGEKGGASVHIENVNPVFGHADHDDIIVSASGEQGFVSIDGKRTYLNLFDSSTVGVSVSPTRVQTLPHSVPPLVEPPLGPAIGTGEAIPADDVPIHRPPAKRPPGPGHSHHPHQPHRQQGFRRPQATVRIDTCIVGDDSTCDQAQNEKCRTEAGISSCQCRPGYARRTHRDPCRRVVSLVLNLRVDKLYERKVVWDNKLLDKDSDPYQQLSYEAIRAIDSAFSMTPFSDDFVSGTVNAIHRGDQHNQGVFVNYTVLMQETPETLRSHIATDIQKHLLGVIRRRSNNVGASALWVDTPAGSVLPLNDLDECANADLNDCHPLATCTNTWGGFRCACPDTTLDVNPGSITQAGRQCQACAASHCNDRGVCRYRDSQPYCSCNSGYYGSTCEVDGEVVGVAVGASLAAALVIALTLAALLSWSNSGYYGSTCEVDGEVVGVAVGASLAAALVIALTLAALLSWSRKWSREQKAVGMGSPVFNYMAANTIKTPPVGGPPYQVTLEERMRWAQIAEAMAQAQYAQPEQVMPTRPSSAMFGGYPTLPPVPMPRMGLHSDTTLGH